MGLASFRKDALRIKRFDTRDEMGKAAAAEAAAILNEVIKREGSVAAVFAAAPSQNEFLSHLVHQPVDFAKVDAFHMDEYIGLPKDAPQAFGNFLKRAIFAKRPFRSVAYMGDSGRTPEEACDAYARLLKENPPDIVFLGIGENGHLAFNDPAEADFFDEATVKIVHLDEMCRRQQVNDGCFARLSDVPLRAITLTIPALMRIPHALCIVPGEKKARALRETVYGPVTAGCPASILRVKAGVTVYTEREGGSLLEKEETQ